MPLHHADALAVLPTVGDNSHDLVICDPPYNVGMAYEGSCNDSLPPREYRAWCAGWFHHCFRIAAKFFIIFPGLKHLADWNHYLPSGQGSWFKPGNPSGGGAFRYCESEPWLLWTKGGAWCSYSDTITAPLPSHGQRDTGGHPCPKPPKLYAELLRRFKPTSVLDPFMGSGTMGVECAKLSIPFTGIELSQVYFATASARIAAALGESPHQWTGQLAIDAAIAANSPSPPSAPSLDCDTAPAGRLFDPGKRLVSRRTDGRKRGRRRTER